MCRCSGAARCRSLRRQCLRRAGRGTRLLGDWVSPQTRSAHEDQHHGAGNIGGTLTRRLAALGHEVFIANSRGPETLRELAAETGATAVSVTEAARDKDVVVITIPEKNNPDLPDDLFAGAGDVVVVDTGNCYPQQRDGHIDAKPRVKHDSGQHAGSQLPRRGARRQLSAAQLGGAFRPSPNLVAAGKSIPRCSRPTP